MAFSSSPCLIIFCTDTAPLVTLECILCKAFIDNPPPTQPKKDTPILGGEMTCTQPIG